MPLYWPVTTLPRALPHCFLILGHPSSPLFPWLKSTLPLRLDSKIGTFLIPPPQPMVWSQLPSSVLQCRHPTLVALIRLHGLDPYVTVSLQRTWTVSFHPYVPRAQARSPLNSFPCFYFSFIFWYPVVYSEPIIYPISCWNNLSIAKWVLFSFALKKINLDLEQSKFCCFLSRDCFKV